MIDRGALVLGRALAGPYRGVHRPPLDAQSFTGKRGREIARRYADAVVAGDGVIEDLDDAIELLREAQRLGVEGLEVIVFEVPQEPPPARASLIIAPELPAEGLALLGYDVIESLEPYVSPLAAATLTGVNACGLFDRRADADALARELNADPTRDEDEQLVAVRVWALTP